MRSAFPTLQYIKSNLTQGYIYFLRDLISLTHNIKRHRDIFLHIEAQIYPKTQKSTLPPKNKSALNLNSANFLVFFAKFQALTFGQEHIDMLSSLTRIGNLGVGGNSEYFAHQTFLSDLFWIVIYQHSVAKIIFYVLKGHIETGIKSFYQF